MSDRRAPVERLVDLAVAIPVSVAVAARQLVPVGVTRLERRIARDLALLQRYARRGALHAEATRPEPATGAVATPEQTASTGALGDSAVEPVADMPIDGYDQLSARQIIDRLPSLSEDELAVVAAHERSHRRRQTVLARIAQLA